MKTIVMVGLAAVGTAVVAASAKRPRARGTKSGSDKLAFDASEVLPPMCRGVISPEDVAAIVRQVEISMGALGYMGGRFGSMQEALNRTFEVTIHALSRLCAGMPLPTAEHQVPGYEQNYGDAFSTVYNTVRSIAWKRVIGE